MPTLTTLTFISLALSFLSLWLKREPLIWGTLLVLSLLFGWMGGHINLIGLSFVGCLWLLWGGYVRRPTMYLFLAIIVLSVCYKLRWVPGYFPYAVTEKFKLGLEGPLVGLFPLALLVPLSRTWEDWKAVLKGVLIAFIGIGLFAGFAMLAGVAHLTFSPPPFMTLRTASNLLFTSIPEEGFFRGFVQHKLVGYVGKPMALVLASLLFMLTHAYWSPNLAILAFTFVAGLLYGAVYWASGKIESAIICHFLLNLIHMLFFSYHAA